jgi:methylase of polypeptide subunit release factors
MTVSQPTINEVDFCGQIASAANTLIQENPAAYPFREVRIEGYGKGAGRRKRKDLRFYGRNDKLVLCGEVKLPGTPEGRSAFAEKLMQDAFAKAEDAGVQFFFTWNVNEFAIFDRGLWERPLLERRIRVWRMGRTLADSAAVAREDNLNFVKTHFLPDLLRDLADIISGRRRDWLPPDDIFIRTLESHLDWPVHLARAHILERAGKSKSFDLRVQRWMTDQDWTFLRAPHEEWAKAVDNMAKTLAYVWANRLIFYKALRARFPDLSRLELRPAVKKPEDALIALNRFLHAAVQRSGDYEPLLMPDATDWATELVFQPVNALDAWRGVLRGIESVDFREVPSDVVGRIFQKLIGPDERHRYGQHFTGDDPVDLVNAFCIRAPGDTVFDPACGSGSFLVRAYYRKRHLAPRRPHLDLIGELFGCDIALYPAHLATLNLAAREISDEANYPRIVRRNFFDFAPPQPFCEIPDNAGGHRAVVLPPLDAVVANPPYVRQEKVDKKDKTRFGRICGDAWPGLRLSGRSDLHCYFWPAAARLLKPEGYFGFLTSSSWMDVEYGFALQGWMLQHFRILAVMESAAEPWFEDARVKTCVAILQRCDDETARMANRVRFVRFSRRLADIIGIPAGQDEGDRQTAVEALRGRILNAGADCQDRDLRIIIKVQSDLWADGVRAGAILGDAVATDGANEAENGETDEEAGEAESPEVAAMNGMRGEEASGYRAGKWGRYVRAPDIYFDIMRRFGKRFVALGEIASIRFGVKTGCDAFFMPKDITATVLRECQSDRTFRQNAGGAPRKDVESGKLRIVEAGDGSVHPIEAEYLAPELHTLRKMLRTVVRAVDLDRVVLLVGEPLGKLAAKSPWVWRYLRYGIAATFASSKSKPVPLPKRSTCAARDPWYDLTALLHPGIAFWPMAHQYIHVIPGNPEGLVCNHRLFDIGNTNLSQHESESLVAILNSTLVALWKNFYGRYTGTEGSLDTEVVDAKLVHVPDPRGVSARLAKRLADALERMGKRDVGRLVEEQLMDCHTPERARKLAAGPLVLSHELQQSDRRDLDDATLQLLGVSDPHERDELIGRLYEATARHFREIRVVEIEKMEQRGRSNSKRFNVHDLAADIWDAAELADATPLAEWIGQQPESDSLVVILEERPAGLSRDLMFSPNTVYFGKAGKSHIDCVSRGQAELIVCLANLGVSGQVKVPAALSPGLKVLDRVDRRVEGARTRFKELAESRTGDERVQAQLVEVLERWFVVGRETPKPGAPPETGESDSEIENPEGS